MRVELGSGYSVRRGWISCDQYLPTRVSADGTTTIQWSAPNPLPFNDDEIDFIYTSHFLEHIHWEDAIYVLTECRRVLKNSGTLRVCLPDSYPVICSYLQKDSSLLSVADDDQRFDLHTGYRPIVYRKDESPLTKVSPTYDVQHRFGKQFADSAEVYSRRVTLPAIFSHIDAVAHLLLADGHKQLYDYAKLSKQLTYVGFNSVSQVKFDGTIDNPDRKSGSFYAVAQ